MATEKSEPNSGIIVKIGILGIVGVLATRFALVPYFDKAVDDLRLAKVGTIAPQAWHELRDAEQAKLTSGTTTIDVAKAVFAQKGRSALQAPLQPTDSKDFGALEGWSNATWKEQPRTLPAALTPDPPPPAAADAGLLDGGKGADGGAVKGDAGPVHAMPSTTGDAGVHPAKAPPMPGQK